MDRLLYKLTKSKKYSDFFVSILVIAGESMETKSPVRTRTPTYYLDFEVKPNASFAQPVPSGWTTFIYTLEGEISLGKSSMPSIKV